MKDFQSSIVGHIKIKGRETEAAPMKTLVATPTKKKDPKLPVFKQAIL